MTTNEDDQYFARVAERPSRSRANMVVLTYGRKHDGRWWARLDTGSHYSRGEGDDAWSAALDATHEAQFLFPDA